MTQECSWTVSLLAFLHVEHVCIWNLKVAQSFTRRTRWTLTWDSLIHSKFPYPIYLTTLIISALHLFLYLVSGSFTWWHAIIKKCNFLVFPILSKRLCHLICHGVTVLAVLVVFQVMMENWNGFFELFMFWTLPFAVWRCDSPYVCCVILRWCHIRVFFMVVKTSNDGVWFVLFSVWPCSALTTMMNIPVFIFIRV